MTDMSKLSVVHTTPGMRQVSINSDIVYKTVGSSALKMDIYRGADADQPNRPVVIFISGYPDPKFEKIMGCKLMEMEAYKSWARLTASQGFVAVTYENNNPEEDATSVVQYLSNHAHELGIDASRMALWSCSANVACALSLLCNRQLAISCAVMCYGYTIDTQGSTSVAQASAQYGFANAMADKSIPDISDTPFLIVRAGKEELPGLNQTLDQFIFEALCANLPVSVINYPAGVHSFDLLDHSKESHAVIKQILYYFRHQLLDSDGA